MSLELLEGFHKTLCHVVALWTFHGLRYGIEADGFGKFQSFLRCVTRAVVPDRPPFYYIDHDPSWNRNVAFDHKFAVVQVALETFGDLNDFRDRFADVVTGVRHFASDFGDFRCDSAVKSSA